MISFQAMRLLFGLLAAGANLSVLAALALLLPAGASARRRVQEALDGKELQLAWIVATVATLGSLYLSEIAHLEPCRMCWYQRIAMYPLVVVLGIAILVRDTAIWRYVVPVAGIGAALSVYHYLVQFFPGLETGACGTGVACSTPYFRQFGFMSIPYMAGSAFLLILTLMLSLRSWTRGVDGSRESGPAQQKESR